MGNKELIAKQKAFFDKLEEILQSDTPKSRGLNRSETDQYFGNVFDSVAPLMSIYGGDIRKALNKDKVITAFEVKTPDEYCLTVRLKIHEDEFYLYRIEDDVKWAYGDIDDYEELDERNHMQAAANKLMTYLKDDLKKAGLKTELNG